MRRRTEHIYEGLRAKVTKVMRQMPHCFVDTFILQNVLVTFTLSPPNVWLCPWHKIIMHIILIAMILRTIIECWQKKITFHLIKDIFICNVVMWMAEKDHWQSDTRWAVCTTPITLKSYRYVDDWWKWCLMRVLANLLTSFSFLQVKRSLCVRHINYVNETLKT